MNILGIHSGVTLNQHDAAAAIIVNGELVAACEEERFVRIKSPRGIIPINSIKACLKIANLSINDIDIAGHPGETYEDLPLRISGYLEHHFGYSPSICMVNHQLAHLASAYYFSGFKEAMCMSYDAFGDKLSASLGRADINGIEVLETISSSNSLGMFYATLTSFLGFRPGMDEFKVMGLAAYADDNNNDIDLLDFLKIVENGYVVNNDYMRQHPTVSSVFEPFYSEKLVNLLGKPRKRDDDISRVHKNIAGAGQKSLEKASVALISDLYDRTKIGNLCLAGVIALNCSANYVIRTLPFINNLFVQPASSDRGLAVGCALDIATKNGQKPTGLDSVFKGPEYSESSITDALELSGFAYKKVQNPADAAAKLLNEDKIVGWFQGRSEFGPRALGNRSILGNPIDIKTKDRINARVKFRESFRPFAPSVLLEYAQEIFDMEDESPFMTVSYPVHKDWVSKLQAVIHVNNTARVQTVSKQTMPLLHDLISKFHNLTGVPVILNTSFNVRGQPIVETPQDAIATFSSCGMDAVIIGKYVITK